MSQLLSVSGSRHALMAVVLQFVAFALDILLHLASSYPCAPCHALQVWTWVHWPA